MDFTIDSGKGQHLRDIIGKFKGSHHHHKNRKINVAITRLRIGHSGLNEHLHRMNQSPTNLCRNCNQPETLKHYLLYCIKYVQQRFRLLQKLQTVGFNSLTEKIILDIHNNPDTSEIRCLALAAYIIETGKLHKL